MHSTVWRWLRIVVVPDADELVPARGRCRTQRHVSRTLFRPYVWQNDGLDLEQPDSVILHKCSSRSDCLFEGAELIDLGCEDNLRVDELTRRNKITAGQHEASRADITSRLNVWTFAGSRQ